MFMASLTAPNAVATASTDVNCTANIDVLASASVTASAGASVEAQDSDAWALLALKVHFISQKETVFVLLLITNKCFKGVQVSGGL